MVSRKRNRYNETITLYGLRLLNVSIPGVGTRVWKSAGNQKTASPRLLQKIAYANVELTKWTTADEVKNNNLDNFVFLRCFYCTETYIILYEG